MYTHTHTHTHALSLSWFCLFGEPGLTQVVITNYHRTGDLDNTSLFLTVLKAGKSKIKVAANSDPGEDSLSGLQIAIFSLFSNDEGRESPLLSGVSSYKDTNSIRLGSRPQDFVKLIPFLLQK